MPHHIFFSTTLLLYKLDTLLLKQKKRPVLDITGFFFRIRTQVTALCLPEYSCGKRNPLYPIRTASFVSIVLYPMHMPGVNCMFKSSFIGDTTLFTNCKELLTFKSSGACIRLGLEWSRLVNVSATFNNNNAKHDGNYRYKDVSIQMLK